MKKILKSKKILISIMSILILFVALFIYKKDKNIITLGNAEYSSEITPLPPIRSLKYILENDGDIANDQKDYFVKNIEEYGDIASRFLIPENGVLGAEKVNIDMDQELETVVRFCAYTANRCPHKIIIIKGDNVIFSTTAGYRNLDIRKLENGAGFYVIWQTEENSKSLDKENMFYKTKFIKVDGKFSPVSEEYVTYTK